MQNSFRETFDRISINILMMNKRQDIGELVEQIVKMNTLNFECNYLRFQGLSGQKIGDEMIKDYIEKNFRWNNVKTKYFLEKNCIRDLRGIVSYRDYPSWEHRIANKTAQFLKFCEEKIKVDENWEKGDKK